MQSDGAAVAVGRVIVDKARIANVYLEGSGYIGIDGERGATRSNANCWCCP